MSPLSPGDTTNATGLARSQSPRGQGPHPFVWALFETSSFLGHLTNESDQKFQWQLRAVLKLCKNPPNAVPLYDNCELLKKLRTNKEGGGCFGIDA